LLKSFNMPIKIKTLEDKYGDIVIHLDTGEIFKNED